MEKLIICNQYGVFCVAAYVFVVVISGLCYTLSSFDEYGRQLPKTPDDYTETEVIIRILLWPIVVVRFLLVKVPIGLIDIIKRG